MFRNYFKTAFRALLKNKTYSVINIIGLSVGTLCCLYILLYVQDQYSYDKHHTQANNIYRITTDLTVGGDRHNNATSSPTHRAGDEKRFCRSSGIYAHHPYDQRQTTPAAVQGKKFI
jgi:uncharacterized alpha/beta hydrolase family protein